MRSTADDRVDGTTRREGAMARDDAVIFGLRAALAVAQHRPEAIRRVFHDESRRRAIGPLLKATAALRRPYREVPSDELERVAGTVHHEGVVVVCDPLPLLEVDDMIEGMPADGVLLALDDVTNPHNQGAIVRSAAWFGAGVLLGGETGPLNPAAVRVAQGGAELAPVAATANLAGALRRLVERGIPVIGADQNAKRRLLAQPLPRPVCLVLGNETHGLSAEVRAVCNGTVRIAGTDAVESLNVAVSAGILLAAAMAGADT